MTGDSGGAYRWTADFSRLLVIITGSLNAAFAPQWVAMLRSLRPQLEYRIVLTRNAERFVTRTAISVIGETAAMADEWDDRARPGSMHTALAEWAEAIVIYPATFQYLARLALGLADTPSLLAVQCTDVPVLVAPSLPPGGWDSPAVAEHVDRLAKRSNISVIPPRRTLSFTTGNGNGSSPPPFLQILEDRGWATPGSDALHLAEIYLQMIISYQRGASGKARFRPGGSDRRTDGRSRHGNRAERCPGSRRARR
jgi:phosphopantothenoylcysteine synthetase/decarboxylase